MNNDADGRRALDFATIGETMLRLTAPAGVALERDERLEVEAAGAESNVAVDLARLGWRTAWISRLPANPLGRSVANRIRQHGVDGPVRRLEPCPRRPNHHPRVSEEGVSCASSTPITI